MEKIKRKENRENWICRYGLQIESCRQCLFDALCSYQDHHEEINWHQEETWMDNQETWTNWR